MIPWYPQNPGMMDQVYNFRESHAKQKLLHNISIQPQPGHQVAPITLVCKDYRPEFFIRTPHIHTIPLAFCKIHGHDLKEGVPNAPVILVKVLWRARSWNKKNKTMNLHAWNNLDPPWKHAHQQFKQTIVHAHTPSGTPKPACDFENQFWWNW